MSNRALTWAYKQTTVKAGRKFVLVTLADLADQEHSCFPGIVELSNLTGIGQSTVREHIEALITLGLISREQRRRKNGARTSNRYYLDVDGALAAAQQAPDSGGSEEEPDDADKSQNLALDKRQKSAHLAPDSGGALVNPQIPEGLNGPVPYATHDGAVQIIGTGPGITPATVSATYGKPLHPADVFAALGHWLPTTFDDTQLTALAHEILAESAAPVVDPTGYVIKTIRNTARADERRRGRWLLRADEIALEAIAYREQSRSF